MNSQLNSRSEKTLAMKAIGSKIETLIVRLTLLVTLKGGQYDYVIHCGTIPEVENNDNMYKSTLS